MFDALHTSHIALHTIKMEKIGNIVGKRLNQHKLGESSRASEVINRANQYLSKTLKCESDDVRATTLKDGILWVRVSSAVWGQETWGVVSPLLKQLQGEYGNSIVKRIRTRTQRKNVMAYDSIYT